jgi:hypothetical protein
VSAPAFRPPGVDEPPPENYGLRLSQYRRREQLTTWVGAGLGGLIVLTSGFMAFQRPPPLVTAITVTLLVCAGGALALARVQFEYQATVLERRVSAGQVKEDQELADVDRARPRAANVLWLGSLYLICGAAVSFLVGVWLTV